MSTKQKINNKDKTAQNNHNKKKQDYDITQIPN